MISDRLSNPSETSRPCYPGVTLSHGSLVEGGSIYTSLLQNKKACRNPGMLESGISATWVICRQLGHICIADYLHVFAENLIMW